MFLILRCRSGVTTEKDWYGVSKCAETLTLADLYDELICGSYDQAPSLKVDHQKIICAFIGQNKLQLTQVSPDVTVSQAVGCLGNFIDFSIGDTPETFINLHEVHRKEKMLSLCVCQQPTRQNTCHLKRHQIMQNPDFLMTFLHG